MNIAIIFAGGTGQRMNTKTKPKQFLELHGKPIIIYTMEHFNDHELIDGIIYDMAPPNTLHQRIVMNLSAEIRN